MKNGARLLYNDPPEDQAALWESRIISQPYAVRETEVIRTAYSYIKSTYLICEKDEAVPPQVQGAFASAAGAEVEKCDAGHSPMLS
jgi:hypothetical protein